MTHIEHRYADRIRQHGYRLTRQREKILDVLCTAGGFSTAVDLYQRLKQIEPAIDLSTLYRTLHFFQSIHLVVSAEIDGETVYDLAPAEPLHHLICSRCGYIQTIDSHHLEPLKAHLLTEHHFEADLTHIAISGLCADCAGKE